MGEREGRRGVAGGSHGDALLRGRRSDIKKITNDEADSSFSFFLFGSREEPWRDKQANGLAVSSLYFENRKTYKYSLSGDRRVGGP